MFMIGGRAYNTQHIRQIGELGYPYAEITLAEPDEVRAIRPELERIRDDLGLYYLAHYPNEDDPFDADILRMRFVPRIKSLLELSDTLDIRKATLHFWMDRRWASPELLEAKAEMLADMAGYAARLGVSLCLENLTEQATSFIPLFNAIPGLNMTLDIGHAQLLSQTNTSFGFIEQCFEHIAHIHVHDNRGGDTVEDDLHLPLGEGIIDYPAIFSRLKEKNYTRTITMEVKVPDMHRTRQEVLKFL